MVVKRIVAVTQRPPLAVDLTRHDLGVPVVRAIVPGFRCPEEL
jgi:ribosomal protein S12 methylthiotransferase accessory factor YcaO